MCAGVYTGVYKSMRVPFDGLLVRRHQERFLWLTETFTHQSRSLSLVLLSEALSKCVNPSHPGHFV